MPGHMNPGRIGSAGLIAITGLLLLGLPLLGAYLAGLPLDRYLEFPPRTLYVDHAPFSWVAFGILGSVALVLYGVLIWLVWPRGPSVQRGKTETARRFPWWGWLAVGLVAGFWFLAWTRLPAFRHLQPYTFTPLWLSYVLFVNALTWWRSGRSLLTHRTGFFLSLFPLSALFWWYFEYLNRFVQNWHYVGIASFGPLQYTVHATLAFSTVLPAVSSTVDWLATFPRLGNVRIHPLRMRVHGKTAARILLMVSMAALGGLGVWPDALFPLVWVAPLLLIVSLQVLAGQPTAFAPVAQGHWRVVSLPMLAALLCGFLWEMWNQYSQARWVYMIPYVQRFELFEMPLLGYVGYLPFGLECMAIVGLLENGRRWAREISLTKEN